MEDDYAKDNTQADTNIDDPLVSIDPATQDSNDYNPETEEEKKTAQQHQ